MENAKQWNKQILLYEYFTAEGYIVLSYRLQTLYFYVETLECPLFIA